MKDNLTKTLTLLTCTLLCTTLFAQQKDTFTDPRDKKMYKTVKIGEQVWLAENLNYAIEGSKCYKDSTAYCSKYGRLYNWETAKTACCKGWHLPSKAEWEVLVAAAGGEKIAGKYLKATNGWNDHDGISGNGIDTYRFSFLPGGAGSFFSNNFTHLGIYGLWWSSSDSSNYAYSRSINHLYDNVHWLYSDKRRLYSVRCLKD
ncbi:MAG: fibrobacter succinogenes major paralogous domain-containing protein [Fibromonadaceae bacterium]|jgi:uncharacterized protein (TIGR02145 family)|nr:fibrobacter succinogenes major paralogous domain-containing protein [Fibromonadaceae bacterium]